MPFKVQVGPHQIAIRQGQTLLVSEQDEQINRPSDRALPFRDTRIISSWAIYADGEGWDLLNGGAISSYASRSYRTNRPPHTARGATRPRSLGLMIRTSRVSHAHAAS